MNRLTSLLHLMRTLVLPALMDTGKKDTSRVTSEAAILWTILKLNNRGDDSMDGEDLLEGVYYTVLGL